MNEKLESVNSRREFLKKAGKASVAAPAVAILLSSTGPANAGIYDPYQNGCYQEECE